MNLSDLLAPSQASPPRWRGQWARIWLQPSRFTPQRFIVGVAMLDSKGLCDWRLITGTAKFECLYDAVARRQVDALLAELRQVLGSARDAHTPVSANCLPPGFALDPVGYAASQSAEHALEEALNEAEIPMEPSPEQARAPRFQTRNHSEVMDGMFNAIRQHMGINAEALLREDTLVEERHTASVNLVAKNVAGAVANGWFANADRVQLVLLQTAAAVKAYNQARPRSGQPAVFLLRPTVLDGLRDDQSEAMEVGLSDLEWKLEKDGLRVSTHNSEHKLAQDVAAWATSS